MNFKNQLGYIVILAVIVGSIIVTIISGVDGMSSWFNDKYIPKKVLILEKFPVRIIMYGQYIDVNSTNSRTSEIIRLINALNTVNHQEGKFGNVLDMNFNSNFNSRQIRSTQRSLYDTSASSVSSTPDIPDKNKDNK